MAKTRERKIAYEMYVNQNKTAKETARLVGVAEKTMSDWVNANNERWKKEREARNMAPSKRTGNIEQIISDLANKRIELGRQLTNAEADGDTEKATETRKEISKIDDAVSKWNKTLRDINKENKVSLAVYLEVMQSIFDALQSQNTKLFMQTLEFQEQHIHDISLKLGM